MQRQVMDVIYDKQEGSEGLDVSDLNRILGGDRSNTRRAVRGLVRRGMVSEVSNTGGERSVLLTQEGWLISVLIRTPLPPLEPEPVSEALRKMREELQWLRERHRQRRCR